MEEPSTYTRILPLQPLYTGSNKFGMGVVSIGFFVFPTSVYFYTEITLWGTIIYLFFVAISVLLQIQTYLQIGLAFKNEKLYRCNFLGDRIFSKKEISTKEAHDVVILRFSMSKTANRSLLSPSSLAIKYENYEIHLLNEAHTNRNFIMSLNNKESAILAALFIEQHTTLFYQNL